MATQRPTAVQGPARPTAVQESERRPVEPLTESAARPADETAVLTLLNKPSRWNGYHRRGGVLTLVWKSFMRLGLPVLGAWLAVAGLHAAGAFADPAPVAADPNRSRPTMTFTAGVNVVGLLNSINVSPANVRVEAGKAVDIVNSSQVALTVSVGSSQVTVPAGQAQGFQFSGGSQQQNLRVSASPLNVPVVGDLVASTGTVVVAPAASKPAPAPAPNPDDESGSSDNGTGIGNADTGEPSPTGDGGAATPIAPLADANGQGSNALVYPGTARNADADDEAATSYLEPTSYRAFSGISERMTLALVVAAILLLGIGFAALRVLFASRRPVG